MENQKHIAIITHEDGDWTGIFIDGVLVLGATTINPEDLLRHLGYKFTIGTYDSEKYNLSKTLDKVVLTEKYEY